MSYGLGSFGAFVVGLAAPIAPVALVAPAVVDLDQRDLVVVAVAFASLFPEACASFASVVVVVAVVVAAS